MTGKKRWIPIICMAFMTMMAATAFGQVSGINIQVTDVLETGEVKEPGIEVLTGGEIEEISWSQETEDWQPGKKVQLTLRLTSEEGFADSYTRSQCKITGADFTSARSTDDGSTLIVKASYVPTVQLAAPEYAVWRNNSKSIAGWKKVKYADAYQVKLYENETLIKSITVESNTVDLEEYMMHEGGYYFEVRAVGKDASARKYKKDSEYTMSEDVVRDDMGETYGDWQVFQEGKKYQKEDGSYASGGWQMIEGSWYYFNSSGYMTTGWQAADGKWYYMDSDGKMLTGWQKLNDQWYYLNENGDMATGWIQPEPGKYYYCYGDGTMAKNTVIDNLYRVDENGLWIQ